jgi:hypothetical protein
MKIINTTAGNNLTFSCVSKNAEARFLYLKPQTTNEIYTLILITQTFFTSTP